VKKVALAGFFLLLLVLGIAFTSTHRSGTNGADAAVLQNDSFNDVINGVQGTVDTTCGQHYITPLGQGGRQWVNGNNVVVESGLSPGVGFTPLTPVSR
jgi:hypothetical protein